MITTAAAGDELAAPGESRRCVTADEIMPLLLPHLPDAFRLSAALLRGDVHEAEDAVQTATGLAWQRCAQLRDRSAARAWFLRIVTNECRRRARDRRRFLPLPFDRLRQGHDPAVTAEQTDVILSALNSLPYKQRVAVVLHRAFGYSLDDVSALTGAPAGTVKSRINRATTALRTRFATGARTTHD